MNISFIAYTLRTLSIVEGQLFLGFYYCYQRLTLKLFGKTFSIKYSHKGLFLIRNVGYSI
jgi:hypothetical protein